MKNSQQFCVKYVYLSIEWYWSGVRINGICIEMSTTYLGTMLLSMKQ